MDTDRILEAETESDNCTESETSSVNENETGGATETANRMKMKAIKVSKLPSFGSCSRSHKSLTHLSPPSYTKATNCSDAKKGVLQVN